MSPGRIATLLPAIAVALATPAAASWVQNGVKLCDQIGSYSSIASDGAGGAYLAWGYLGVNVQRVTVSGDIPAGWGPTGNRLYSGLANAWVRPAFVADGTGGAFVVWEDYRDAAVSGYDIYALRFTSAGTLAPGWPAAGIPVCTAADYQTMPLAVSDGAGGAIIVFRNGPYGNFSLRARRIAPDGTLTGAAAGVVLTSTGSKDQVRMASDGLGGALLTWQIYGSSRDVFAQRVTPGTLAPAWGAAGVPVATGPAEAYDASPAPDGAGGGFIAWTDTRNAGQAEIYTQHYTGIGALSGGWPAGGRALCTAPGGAQPVIVPDGAGGFIVCWMGVGVRAMRRAGNGAVAPGWDPAGVQIGTIVGDALTAIGDGAGGALVAWTNTFDVYSQRVTGDGAIPVGWDPAGEPVTLGIRRDFFPQMVLSDIGTMIVGWTEDPGTIPDPGPFSIWAQRVPGVGAPVAIAISLVSAEAEPDLARLRWSVADGAGARATVERRSEAGDWGAIAAVDADGAGDVRYEDRDVAAGAHYAYRLRVGSGGSEVLSEETWVEIPGGPRFALEAVAPNPSAGELALAFTLPDAAPATLTLLDLAGRRLEAREVGSLGTGRHTLRIGEGTLLAPGIYVVRLARAGRSLTARACIVR